MKKKTTFAALAAFALSVSAQESFRVSPLTTTPIEPTLQERIKNNQAAEPMQKMSSAQKSRYMKAWAFSAQNKQLNPTDYGTEVEILFEDFSKFTTGSMEAPDMETDIRMSEYIYPWINVQPQYTNTPGWGAENVFPAGGVAYLGADELTGMAHINTPMLDVSDNCGIAFIEFNVRTVQGIAVGMMVEAAETFNMSPTWNILGNQMCPEMNEEWQTFRAQFYGGGETTIFNIVQALPSPVFVDDVRVYQIDQFVDTPVTLPHSDYKGTSFNANWMPVEGAEAYSLTVFAYDEATESYNYILENQRVEGTSYTVTGVESGAVYYYTLHAIKGEHISMETMPVEVFDLEAPVMNKASEILEGKYTASWNQVPTADVYNYWTYCERIAEADGEFVVTDENFDGIKDADGNETGWTLEDPSYNSYDELYLSDLNQGGWRGTHYAPYTDYICLDGWHYMVGNGDAGLISPELDLSKDGGKINISVRLYGELTQAYEQTGAAIALFNYDEELGDYTQVELVYPEGVVNEWKTFNVTLTKGSARSTIGIYAVKAGGNLYLDDLRITQNYKAGEKLIDPFLHKRYHEDTTLEVIIPKRAEGTNIYHKVSAMKSKSMDGGYSAFRKESEFSALELVGLATTGIEQASLEAASVVVDGNRLMISNPENAAVMVYHLNGQLMFADESGDSEITTVLPERGVYLVKVGNATRKVIY